MKRTLSLKRESLSELATDELTSVVGAALPTIPRDQCLDDLLHTKKPTQCYCP